MLWIPISLAAATFQILRTSRQHELRDQLSAGAAGFVRAIAHEVARHGVTANNIALGTMRTPVSGAFWDDPDNPVAKQMLKRYLVRRPGDPADPAGLALYLASDGAAWITGQTYPVNGGISFTL